MKDEMSEAYSDYVNSDTLILVMNTAQGFISHNAKAFLDRTILHFHPYLKDIAPFSTFFYHTVLKMVSVKR